MNEEYRDVEEVLMVIKKATMFADPIMKIATKGLAKIVQFLARMVKEKIIDKRNLKTSKILPNEQKETLMYLIFR